MEQQNGILVLDKPKGLSSAQCVARVKRLGQKKIGHAGTLDPMATGVLLILLGQATKLSNYLLEGGEKTYLGTLRLGLTTDTWDIEGRTLSSHPLYTEAEATACHASLSPASDALEGENLPEPSGMPFTGFSSPQALEQAVQRDIAAWIGEQDQPVPPYSAAKHQGQALYKLARAGKEVPAKRKRIHISHAEVQWVNLPEVRFRVTCSSGSYIRSLAHSLGMRLGCGAVLTALTREYSHPFNLDEAHSLETLLAEPETLPAKVLPLSAALPHWPTLVVPAKEEAALRNGTPLAHLSAWGNFQEGARALFMDEHDEPLALAEATLAAKGPACGRPSWVVLRGLFTP